MSETERERRRFYRVKEAAAIMGVPLRTMYHLCLLYTSPSPRD